MKPSYYRGLFLLPCERLCDLDMHPVRLHYTRAMLLCEPAL